ncbi:multiple epidermal growth factor-like domains protein 6 isoform X2 [Ornithodoros turicata]|uniref:multiple epidermal growth factor-like domains protein 6 isoform X2 n=1 Tax=Ornithodoros turicata TaxID=34597 RepID=UPI0031392C52
MAAGPHVLVLLLLSITATQAVRKVRCPDRSYCKLGSTCCLQKDGKYGCCPYELAQCCSDHAHCCPEGYTCLVSDGTCVRATFTRMAAQVLDTSEHKEDEDIERTLALTCPDGTTCTEDSTCCQLKGGDYGCCQFKDAVCCPDQDHCCPDGYSCGPDGTCTKDARTVPMAKKYQSLKPNLPVKENTVFINISRPVSSFGDVLCPDGNVCDPGSTCCEIADGAYGCCPLLNAVCCSDKVHCCPSGYRCDTSEGRCLLKHEVRPTVLQQSTNDVGVRVQGLYVECPDHSFCGDGSTCCLSTSGRYACCPYSNAECCSDHVHCCPEGYRCLISRGSCVRVSTRIAANRISPATSQRMLLSFQSQYVQCPDRSYCPTNSTCCLLTTGRYGCCPYDHAECCSDHRSCCPEGYRCQVSSHTCTKGSTSIAMSEKRPSLSLDVVLSIQSQYVPCPDRSYCPTNSTCCLLTTGQYGCCPYDHAECCSDHRSCCPEGYRCQVSSHTCTKGSTSIAMSEKRPSLSLDVVLSIQSQYVPCPDRSYCPTNSTCCLLTTGQYGCCPYDHAECCSDHRSCCPEGYRCQVSSHSCTKGSTSIAMSEKRPSLSLDVVLSIQSQYVPCPDRSYCPTNSTCCLLTTGQYGCCPYDHAECCSDHRSCCPEGYRCQVSSHTCTKGSTSIAMSEKRPSLSLDVVLSIQSQYVPCPDRSYCPTNSTCCLLRTGQYGCCPYDHAECCSDHRSCCPEGYRCQVSSHSCTKGSTSIAMSEKRPSLSLDVVLSIQSQYVPCPDRSYCPTNSTCCLLTTGQYGCCPYDHAECCSDHRSCCPEGYRCQVSSHTCTKGSTSIAMSEKRPSLSLDVVLSIQSQYVPCPDRSYCPTNSTCCLLTTGRYGCCPYDHAECCSDHRSCCPEGYRCQVSSHTCTKGSTSIAMSEKRPSLSLDVVLSIQSQYVPCPDRSYCPTNSTCCLLTTGQYGCCPYDHAECCSDHRSCCPEGYRCQVSSHTCTKGSTSIAMSEKRPSLSLDVVLSIQSQYVPCPDRSYCPTNSTCCLLTTGRYGCCPYDHAECCSDHRSCCPEGYRCQVSSHTCTKGSTSIAMSEKRPSLSLDVVLSIQSQYVPCPDRSYCPTNSTCCLLTTGQYGCCPYDHAECCSDHRSCCPEGYRCQVSSHSCTKGSTSIAMSEKCPSLSLDVVLSLQSQYVQCPDRSYCPANTTCCLLTTGRYGCCPYDHAECCSDHRSCCPEGYRCQVSSHTCTKGSTSIPMSEKRPSLSLDVVLSIQSQYVQCPDHSYCPANSTCCLLTTGRYGCCPYHHAECCSDHRSCCPEGYRCQISKGTCTKGSASIAMSEKRPSLSLDVVLSIQSQYVQCPDHSYCPANSTCCLLTTGRYGCCPYHHAECCSDHRSCCPEGYRCQISKGTCTKGSASIAMSEKRPSLSLDVVLSIQSQYVPCPDRSYCPTSSTCCLLTTGRYGCCPYDHAECCSDHRSCCPEGYRCQVSSHTCTKGSTSIAMSEKRPSLSLDVVLSIQSQYVPCPDRSYCPTSSTCCLLTTGQYGCCPYDHAECCSDHRSCCPEGYRCQVSSHTCTKGSTSIPMSEKRPSLSLDVVLSIQSQYVPCPDRSYCPTSSTCCLLTTGQYGCCPYDHAECCSDHRSCCPEGYRCQVSSHTCTKGSTSIPMSEKRPSLSLDVVLSIQSQYVQCPDHSYCPANSTCCLLTTGRYGCCPYHHAECCSDHRSCCPEGYRCQISKGTCTKGSASIAMSEKRPSLSLDVVLSIQSQYVPCPDRSYCPTNSTCCLLTTGQYGCCPYDHAECCSDHRSCCPEGYRCQVSSHTCTKGSTSIAMSEKRPSLSLDVVLSLQSGPVLCSGNTTRCAEGSTCCPLAHGGYGCCPYKDAECCYDGIHCCSRGYHCDFTGACVFGPSTSNPQKKLPSAGALLFQSLFSSEITCPDQTRCPGGRTCCKTEDGKYGCCPFSEAVCCDDGVHCCPTGHQCNLAEGTCESQEQNQIVPMLKKFPSTPAP